MIHFKTNTKPRKKSLYRSTWGSFWNLNDAITIDPVIVCYNKWENLWHPCDGYTKQQISLSTWFLFCFWHRLCVTVIFMWMEGGAGLHIPQYSRKTNMKCRADFSLDLSDSSESVTSLSTIKVHDSILRKFVFLFTLFLLPFSSESAGICLHSCASLSEMPPRWEAAVVTAGRTTDLEGRWEWCPCTLAATWPFPTSKTVCPGIQPFVMSQRALMPLPAPASVTF